MMSTFIARMIMEATDKSLEEGQEKYRAYFVNHKLYVKWQADADAILEVEGYGEAIVTR